jgi:Ca2+/Na+ antiporter
MAIMLLRHRLRPFVTLASLILFLVLFQTLYPELGLSSSGSQTSAIDRQEKGYQNIAARRILSFEHETIFSSELGGISLPAATGLNHGLGNVSTRKVISKPCEDVRNHTGFPSACAYVRGNTECHSGTLVEYTTLFYCRFAKMHLVGYLLLFIWLVMLFYMLGNTAADYFCYSLKKLSNLLQLPPTVAGVSLLPLGNGAPDVFASIAAFMGTGHSQVGLNSVLGGAVFVTSVVAGSVCLAVQFRSHESSRVHLDSCCFLRDMGFFLFTLGILCAIIVIGEIHFWESVAYLSIYVLYAISVAAFACMKTSTCIKQKQFLLEKLLTGMSTFWFIPSPSLFLYQFPLNYGMKSEECLSIKLLVHLWMFLMCCLNLLRCIFEWLEGSISSYE